MLTDVKDSVNTGVTCKDIEVFAQSREDETCPRTRFILRLAEILVLAGGAILPALAVPASTRIVARLKRVQEHSSRVNIPPVAC